MDRRQDTHTHAHAHAHAHAHTHRKPDEEGLKQDRRGVEATVSRYLCIIDTHSPNVPPICMGGSAPWRGTPPGQLAHRLSLREARVETMGVKEGLELEGWSQRRVDREEEDKPSDDDRRWSRSDDDRRQSQGPA